MRKPAVLACLMMFALVTVVGCGPDTSAKTPKEAVKNMATFLKEGKREAFLDQFAGTEEQKKIPAVMFDVTRAMVDFQEAFVAEYGEEAWKKTGGEGKSPGAQWTKMEEDVEKMEVEIDGDTATATLPDQQQPMKLVKKDRAWKISAEAMVPPGQNAEAAADMMAKMAQVYEDHIEKIDKSELSAEELNKMMGQAMMEAMFGEMMKGMEDGMRNAPQPPSCD